MRRYDPYQPEIIGRHMYECHNGDYVKYDDIKDDRTLLEEAKGVLEKIYDKRFSVVAFLDYNEIKDFLARAKERLQG